MKTEELRKFSEIVIQFYEKLSAWEIAVARNSGLSTQQNHTIAIVGNAGQIRMKPLAEKLGVTTGTLTVMIDRLQKADYVRRQPDPADGRRVPPGAVRSVRGHGRVGSRVVPLLPLPRTERGRERARHGREVRRVHGADAGGSRHVGTIKALYR